MGTPKENFYFKSQAEFWNIWSGVTNNPRGWEKRAPFWTIFQKMTRAASQISFKDFLLNKDLSMHLKTVKFWDVQYIGTCQHWQDWNMKNKILVVSFYFEENYFSLLLFDKFLSNYKGALNKKKVIKPFSSEQIFMEIIFFGNTFWSCKPSTDRKLPQLINYGLF